MTRFATGSFFSPVQLRENFATQAALARALYRDTEFDEARGWVDRALASGVVDAGLLFRAAKQLNPFVESFHFHH